MKRDITQCPDFCNERDNRIDDESVGNICLYLENQYGLQLSQPRILEMQKTTSKERGFNPVQNFIMSDSWYEYNAEAIAFAQFYRENFPMQYRDWQTGRWQQGIAYRDSLRHAHYLSRLKRLYSTAE